MRDTVSVTVCGEVHSLPITMAALEALGVAGVCPIYLASIAQAQGKPFALTLSQALKVLEVGLREAGKDPREGSRHSLWVKARGTAGGVSSVSVAAITYQSAFLRELPEPKERPPGAESDAPKQ